MFGYVKPDNPYLYMKDDTLYRAMYCGLCKSLKNEFGEISRFSLTYDMSFMSAFLHNYLGVDVKIIKGHCITHIIRQTPIAQPDEISYIAANLNVILTWYKVSDDIADEGKGKGLAVLFKKAYKKAKKNYPNIDGIVKDGFKKLTQLEKDNCDSVDVVSDCFATMLSNISKEILKDKSTVYTDNLFYMLGKWIYLIDAFDDYDKDLKKQSFNVFYNSYKCISREQLIKQNINDVIFIFNDIFYQIKDNYSHIKMKFNDDLISNILLRGLSATTRKIVFKESKEN